MYALTYTSCRLARKIPSAQICHFSKFTSFRELGDSSTRVATTTVIQKTTEEQRRPFSLETIRNSGSKQINDQFQAILCQSKDIFRQVKFSDLKDAPQPAFWYGVGGLVPFVVPGLSALLLGYSPFLATSQLYYGATICAFLGGVKWGNTVDERTNQQPTWENLGYAVVPQLVAWTGLLLPQSLGFLFVAGGLLSAAYIDLTSPYYPAWFKASRLALTLPAVFFLLVTWFLGLFH